MHGVECIGQAEIIKNYIFDEKGVPLNVMSHYISMESDGNHVVFTLRNGKIYKMHTELLKIGDDRTRIREKLEAIGGELLKENVLNLDSFMHSASNVKEHTAKDVFFHLVEEVGEVATCIQRPHKAIEPLVGELADVLNCTLDIYFQEYGSDLSLLQEHMDKKCAKWLRVQGK